MEFKGVPSPEGEKIIKVTKDEFEIITLTSLDPKQLNLLKEKGIEIDSGEIILEVDGEKMTITTRKDDFGTVVSHEGHYGEEE
ncbi:hypothetical protein K8R66_03130 [bacterium]|nr:hypothetical protein [bacterium]